eukprot:TRINITY_DN5431_c1_g1_i2.p1 TRINITY_DN5431_c1_g1~~TRINITY_DN5431_c1_g1_i2.p1  ORF type:complete len:532 (+),score=60.73 TRINITY_DN5431_c1_g1_i2:168-1763(+)
MGMRRGPCAAVDGIPTPSRASPVLPGTAQAESETLKERARLEQELESDRRFFADPPEDYVRCPTCNVVYAVNSRPATPTDPLNFDGATFIPAAYSKDLPRCANLNLDEAMRHMHRSRFRCTQCDTDFCRCGFSPYHWGWSCDGWQRHQQSSDPASASGSCRWCAQPCTTKLRRPGDSHAASSSSCCGSDEGNDLSRFPPFLSCAEKTRRACGKRHSDCGHFCGGVRGEDRCLPCLHPECRRRKDAAKLPDGDDWCPICWTEPLNAAPAIQLSCGHVLHQHCAEAFVLKGRNGGRRLTFKNIRCPVCQAVVHHPSLNALVAPQLAMYQKVRRKALQRWVVEQRRPSPRAQDHTDEERIASLAMHKMAFFECSQCNEPYYGGEVECGEAEEEEEELDEDVQAALAMELVCRGCASKGQLQCPEHGTEFLGWKCRYCCEREAHYFCFGTTHFCYHCHDMWQTGVEQRRKLQAGKPCLGKDKCIFGGRHPPGARNGRDEYALGCTICAQDTECGMLVNRERKAARRKLGKACSVM